MISTPAGPDRVALSSGVPEPAPAPGEALVAVKAFSRIRRASERGDAFQAGNFVVR
jgi:NADPH:quinone reductase-like Zn-dependent oxidoreductase